ncbi:hypothetical protein KKA09_01195 [Patescibacteria group bacterium]|nr:hypothetical protein [Patescibacteria group bacterium]
MITNTIIKTKNIELKIFEEAREAIIKLETLSRLLPSSDLETLEILLDKKAVNLLSKSLKEAEKGKIKPIEKFFKSS